MMRRHRAAATVVGALLLLSAVELVRVLFYDRPREYDAGFYPAESIELPEGSRQFRWTRGDAASLLRPLWRPVVRIPVLVSHPALPPEGVVVRLFLQDRLFDERTLFSNGWHRLDYYLPALLGTDPWRDDGGRMSAAGVAELEPVSGEQSFAAVRWVLQSPPDYVRVFAGWHRPPGPPSVWFRVTVSATFVPARHGDTADRRELGVGIGEILWRHSVGQPGIGVYAAEVDSDGQFQWTQQRASVPIEPAPGRADRLALRARAAHPDAGRSPVRAFFFWNADAVATVDFGGPGWQEVILDDLRGAAAGGVLSVRVSRTWNAAAAQAGLDDRDLGIALGTPRWTSGDDPG